MALPKIDLPIFELTLPSSGEKIKYRPFTVKEEKILLVAKESGDSEQEIVATKQIANNCLIDKDVSDMAMFDFEYILLVLRSRSVDNEINFSVKDPETDESIPLTLDIDCIKLKTYPSHSKEVKINDDYTLYLKYPSIDQFISIGKMDTKDPLANYYIMVSCLDKVASEDEVHDFKDYTQEDIDSFMENLSGDVINGIKNFFETMPKLRHELKYKNNLGHEKTFVLEGIKSFFI